MQDKMQDKLEYLASVMGVSVADVELLASLTATQVKAGKEGADAIEAANGTMQKLCNRAFESISKNDPTNPYGHRDTFLPAVYQLLTAA